MVNSRFQKMTRDSTAEDRRTFNGSANRIVLMGLMWRRRKVHCLFGFASEGMKSGSGALLDPLYPRLEIQQSGKHLHLSPNKHWQVKTATVEAGGNNPMRKVWRKPQRESH